MCADLPHSSTLNHFLFDVARKVSVNNLSSHRKKKKKKSERKKMSFSASISIADDNQNNPWEFKTIT